jgi:hypothetical protein
MRNGHLFTNHTQEAAMPFQMPADLRAQLDALEAATREVKDAARAVAKERSPLAKAVRDLQYNLKNAQERRHKMIYGNGVCLPEDERTAERIHGQRFRDTLARIASLKSELVDAELRLAFFDTKDNT